MHRLLRVVAMLLTVSLAAAWPEAQAMPFAGAPAPHSAGCHGQRPANPAPASTRYECCANGHHAAVPSGSFSLQVAAVQVGSLGRGDGCSLAWTFGVKSATFLFPSNSPPGAAPLRI
jgi:hypothetical protein